MVKPTKYAFKHKETGDISLLLFLGTGDSIGNYEEITEEEYIAAKEAEEAAAKAEREKQFPKRRVLEETRV